MAGSSGGLAAVVAAVGSCRRQGVQGLRARAGHRRERLSEQGFRVGQVVMSAADSNSSSGGRGEGCLGRGVRCYIGSCMQLLRQQL
jgi:hypothetical protein